MLFEEEEVPTYLQDDLISAPTNALPTKEKPVANNPAYLVE
jgi:hypothetical protein